MDKGFLTIGHQIENLRIGSGATASAGLAARSGKATPPFAAPARAAAATPGGATARKSLSPSVRPHTALQGPCEVRK